MSQATLFSLALLVYAAPAAGFSTFHINCTIPDHPDSYVQAPNSRGSLDIVWSCLATLLACTYTVLHLNVPEQRDGKDGASETYTRAWWKGTGPGILMTAFTATGMACPRQYDIWVSPDSGIEGSNGADTTRPSRMKRFLSKVYWSLREFAPALTWTVITMIAPEIYACLAVAQLDSARGWKQKFQELPPRFHPAHGWTLTHLFFADMGGFAIRANTVRRDPQTIHLTAQSLLALIHQVPELDVTRSLPSENDILDRSKSDAFAKSLVIFQIGWFVVNCITRLARGLDTTQLEMGITGTAICSLVTYAMLFKKPRSVTTPIILLSFECDLPDEIAGIVALDDTRRNTSTGTIRHHKAPHAPDGVGLELWRPDLIHLAVLGAGAVIIGAFHLAAWGFSFPTATDKWVWRIASLGSVCVVVFLFAEVLLDELLQDSSPRARRAHEVLEALCFCLCTLLYVGSRAVLVVEMVRFLFYIPPGAFSTTWADNVPHI